MQTVKIFAIALLVAMFSCKSNHSGNGPINLTCEKQTAPLGIDITNPVFGWQIADTSFGITQGAYQILVSTSVDSLTEKNANIWNSGMVKTSQSQFVAYGGKPLQSTSRYFWCVQTFDTAGIASGYSKPAIFETSFLGNNNWKAEFISTPKNLATSNSICFRKEIKTEKKIAHARAYATGLGAYVLYINGNRVGNQKLAPGWTVFSKHLQYQVYDVDTFFKKGNNAIGTLVSKYWQGAENITFNLTIKLEYTDGSTEWIYTDKSWKAAAGSVLNSGYGIGEVFDASKEQKGWNESGFDSKSWSDVKVVKNSSNLTCSQLTGIKVIKNISPVKIFKSGSEKYVLDMGETISGWVKINALVAAKENVTIKYLSTYNFKDKKTGKVVATDEIRSAKNLTSWEPEFSYHIFRYVEVEGLKNEPDSTTVIGQLATPDVPQISNFSCSNELINKISEAIVRTGRNLMVEQLTGFPDAESKSSTGLNAQAFANTAGYIFDMNLAYDKYLNDLRDIQGKDGKLYFANGTPGNISVGWGDVLVQLPWQAYISSGDKRILTNNYAAMQEWQSAQQRQSDGMAPPYMLNLDGKGDIFSSVETPTKPISSAYYFHTSNTMSQVAEAIGNTEDATVYMELAGFTKDQYNQSYLTYRVARYWAPTQTAHIIPLAVGLAPLSHSQRIADFIASDISKNGNSSTTGALTTHFLLPMLSQYNHHELAYKLISQTAKPSLGYMVEKASSTIWGSWDGAEEASAYQLAFASAGEWLYAYLVGLQLDTKQPGFKHVIFDPNPVQGLNWAGCSVNTSYGKVAARWDKTETGLKATIEVPSNTSMTLMLPVKEEAKATIKLGEKEIIKEGKLTSQSPAYIKFKGFDANMAVFEVGSGKFTIVSE